MRILLVEDKKENIEAAKVQLAGHDLTITTGFDWALKALEESMIFDTRAIHNALYQIFLEERQDLGVMFFRELKGITYKVSDDGSYAFVYKKNLETIADLSGVPSGALAEIVKIVEDVINKNRPNFDVVLTDVMFPKGGVRCLSIEGRELARKQGEMPYGPIVALHALAKGVKKVGILTAGCHHADPVVFALDDLSGFSVGDVKVVCSNRMDTYVSSTSFQTVGCGSDEAIRVKDWAKLLEEVMA